MATKEVEEKTTLTRKTTVYICDICGDENCIGLQKCFICDREICSHCRVYMPDSKMWWHDYNYCCCSECWSIGEECRRYLDEKENNFREVVASEVDLWKIKAKNLVWKGGEYEN